MNYKNLRIGNGFDVHAFAEGRDLYLGGIKIDHHAGLQGHSDADVLIHAIIDALLGAAGIGDIGQLFPDNEMRYKNIRSTNLLSSVGTIFKEKNITVINIDCTIICEKPRILPYVPAMKKSIAECLGGMDSSRIGIKGTTTEKLGFTGRSEGIASMASALILLSE